MEPKKSVDADKTHLQGREGATWHRLLRSTLLVTRTSKAALKRYKENFNWCVTTNLGGECNFKLKMGPSPLPNFGQCACCL